MYIFFIAVHIFVSLVLIGVILMQAGRGGGVSEVFGGGSTQTIFGTSATKFLQRATAACAIIFIVTSLSLAILSSRRSKSLMGTRDAAVMDAEDASRMAAEDAAREAAGVTNVDFGDEETAKGAVEKTGEEIPIEPISE